MPQILLRLHPLHHDAPLVDPLVRTGPRSPTERVGPTMPITSGASGEAKASLGPLHEHREVVEIRRLDQVFRGGAAFAATGGQRHDGDSQMRTRPRRHA